MYGTQTDVLNLYHQRKFENDVKMYGTQTLLQGHYQLYCLRMM